MTVAVILSTVVFTSRNRGGTTLQQGARRTRRECHIGIDIDYEVLGQNNGMLMVSVSGTAVVC